MARKAMIEKEKRREHLVKVKWEKREELKKVVRDLTTTEEEGDSRADRLGVDQVARRRCFLKVHALLNVLLQLQEALAKLVTDQLIDGLHTAVTEVIDIVRGGAATGLAQC